jgi:hypothetical protein
MLKFTLVDGAPIWIDADKVVAVQRSALRFRVWARKNWSQHSGRCR